MLFLYSSWLKLPIATRHKIAAEFNIQKRGGTEVANNEVVKDGYILGDIESALNIDALQKYTNSVVADNSDYALLWAYMVDKIEGRFPPVVEIVPSVITELPIPVVIATEMKDNGDGTHSIVLPKKKGGRPAGSKNKRA